MASQGELLRAPIPDPAAMAPRTEAFDSRRCWNSRRSVRGPVGIMAAVGVISLLHYQTSVHLFATSFSAGGEEQFGGRQE